MDSPITAEPTLSAIARNLLSPGKPNRIVIKVGSALLVENRRIDSSRINALCHLIADLSKQYEVILVTSGAIAAGYTEVPLDKSFLPNKQALASLGQPLLMHMYFTEFQKFGLFCSQLLLGAYDFDSRKRTKSASNAMEVLLANNIVPIINENDATALAEILFGDNDQMSAHIAAHFDAHMLIILSDIAGYYDSNPKENPDAKLRKFVHELTREELDAPVTPNDPFATGGIVTKLKAAQFLLENNRKMFLTSGYDLRVLREYLLNGSHESGTLFAPDTCSH